MPFAICFDTSMLVGLLLFVLVLGAIVVTPIVYALVAFVRWADARQKRLAAESWNDENDRPVFRRPLTVTLDERT